MFLLHLLLVLVPSQSTLFHPTIGGSPIQACRTLSSLGQGLIYLGSTSECEESSLIVIKCDKHGSLEREFNISREIFPISSLVYETVFEASRPLQICFTMKFLGPNLATIRDKNPATVWPWSAVAFLGTRIVEQLALVHQSGYAHRDLHFGNIVASDQNVTDLLSIMSQNLVIIDFGDAVRIDEVDKSLMRSDLLQVLVALRYLVDGDYRYYVEKRYGFNPKTAMGARGICIDSPAAYCELLTYVFKLKPKQIPDYGFVLSQLSDM